MDDSSSTKSRGVEGWSSLIRLSPLSHPTEIGHVDFGQFVEGLTG